MLKFKKEQIEAALMLLESIEIKGTENAKRLVMLRNILTSGIKENENGSKED